jgi:ATP-dependent Clp protease protease subunit
MSKMNWSRMTEPAQLSVRESTLTFHVSNEINSAGETVVNVNGVIGDDWDGLGCADVVPMIQQCKTPLRMRINTPGGVVYDALDIYDAMLNHPHGIVVDILGCCASAGTLLAAAADVVNIQPAAKFMVHRAWSGMLLMGNSEEMRGQMAELTAYVEYLEALDVELAQVLADGSGNDLQDVVVMMEGPAGVDGTTWVGQAAVDAGFADHLIENKKRASSKASNKDGSRNEQFRDRIRSMALQRMKLGSTIKPSAE